MTQHQEKKQDTVRGILMPMNKPHRIWYGCHRDKGGQYGFPGGKVEPGESLEEALKREFAEECGLKSSDFQLLRKLGPMTIRLNNHNIHYFVGYAKADLRPVGPSYEMVDLQHRLIEDVRWDRNLSPMCRRGLEAWLARREYEHPFNWIQSYPSASSEVQACA